MYTTYAQKIRARKSRFTHNVPHKTKARTTTRRNMPRFARITTDSIVTNPYKSLEWKRSRINEAVEKKEKQYFWVRWVPNDGPWVGPFTTKKAARTFQASCAKGVFYGKIFTTNHPHYTPGMFVDPDLMWNHKGSRRNPIEIDGTDMDGDAATTTPDDIPSIAGGSVGRKRRFGLNPVRLDEVFVSKNAVGEDDISTL